MLGRWSGRLFSSPGALDLRGQVGAAGQVLPARSLLVGVEGREEELHKTLKFCRAQLFLTHFHQALQRSKPRVSGLLSRSCRAPWALPLRRLGTCRLSESSWLLCCFPGSFVYFSVAASGVRSTLWAAAAAVSVPWIAASAAARGPAGRHASAGSMALAGTWSQSPASLLRIGSVRRAEPHFSRNFR